MAALLAGCATIRAPQPGACPTSLAPVSPDALPDLSGTYRLVIVNTGASAKPRVVRGTLTLAARRGPHPGKGMLGSVSFHSTMICCPA